MKIFSTSSSFLNIFPFLFLLAAFFCSSAAVSAQIGSRAGIYNLKFAGEEKITSVTARPRVVGANAETKPSGGNVTAAMISDFEHLAFRLINEKRAEQNLSPLKWNDDVARVARVHSQNMAEYKFLGHQGTDGSMVDDRADRVGLNKWRAIGENIAYNRGYAQPIEFAVERWMLSPKHKENLLSPSWQESAIGIAVTADGTYYLTQVFLLRK